MDNINNVNTIQSTALWPDISDIINNKDGNTSNISLDIDIKIHNELYDITKYEGLSMIGTVISRDYVGNIGDYMEAVFKIPLGTYILQIYPYLNNTEVSFIRDERIIVKGKPSVRIERYKAVFLKDRNASLPTHVAGSLSDMNQSGTVPLVLQLIDRSVEVLRIKTTFGAFDKASVTETNVPNYKINDFLSSILSQEANKIILDGKAAIDFIDIEKPDNTENLSSLVLPSGSRILEIPTVVQEDSTGIYNSGIGTYIQRYNSKRGLYVYSLYNPTKYNDSLEKIVFLVPLTSNYSIGQHTYSYKDNLLRVVTEANSNIMSFREAAEMELGSGFRNTDANAMMKKPVEMTADGPKAIRHQLNTEVVAKDRADGMNYASVRKGDQISNNIFKKMSIVNRSLGSLMTLVWHSADYELLFPGASCKIITIGTSLKPVELYGVIQKVDITISSGNSSSAALPNRRPTYDVTCIVTVFILNDSLNTI